MNTELNRIIASSEDAKQFLTDLHNNGEAYHPEDSAFGVWDENNNQLFTDAECDKLNDLMVKVHEHADFDPCEFLLSLEEIETGSDFSGVGAFDQALLFLGIKQKKQFVCDMDKYARDTYVRNYGTEEDILILQTPDCKFIDDCYYREFIADGEKKPSKADWDRVHEMEERVARSFSFYFPWDVNKRAIPKTPLKIYMTSPPCQGFSMAGLRKGSILFLNSHHFIKENHPKFFIFENVKGLLSHDKKDKKHPFGYTFNQWLAYLGGKSVNGNETIFPHEQSVPYHIYHSVLNAKDFGVPQNRERVFIIGVRDDEDNSFLFPKGIPLEKRLKDVLESDVDEKYYLSEKMLQGFIAHLERHEKKGNNFVFDIADLEGTANTITDPSKMRSSDNWIITEGFINKDTQASQVYSDEGISPALIAGSHGHAMGYVDIKGGSVRGRDPENPKSRKKNENGYVQMLEINERPDISNAITTVEKDAVILETTYKSVGYTRDSKGKVTDRHLSDICNTVHTSTGSGGNTDQFILEENIEDKTVVLIEHRGHKNKDPKFIFDEIVPCLRAESHGNETKVIVDQDGSPSTYSNPELKKLFSLDGDEDAAANRVYDSEGLSCTIMSGGGVGGAKTGLYLVKRRIRRLTPRECFRLMGFPDTFFWDVSDTQAYKQAGNSIVRHPLVAILKNLLKLQQ